MRDRLKDIILQNTQKCDSTDCITCKYWNTNDCGAVRIADSLIEKGVIVPPCKVGEIVWINNKYGTMPAKVCKITQIFYGSFMVNLRYDLSYCYNNRINTNGAVGYIEDKFEFGKTVYHTKEEAEQALKEDADDGC